jgi:hypothetical protein
MLGHFLEELICFVLEECVPRTKLFKFIYKREKKEKREKREERRVKMAWRKL